MFKSILVVCVGNICRSPLGERLLLQRLQGLDKTVSSAGIAALVGHRADRMALEVAADHGVSLGGHVARAFTPELGSEHDLILVMEPGHRHEIARLTPQLLGRTMLFDQWTGAKGIADPYQRSREFHVKVHEQIRDAADAWAERLTDRRKVES